MVFVLLLTGCESNPTEVEEYVPEPVLSAFLTNGEPVLEVFLERVAPIFDYYSFKDAAISDAHIRIFEIDGGDTLHLSEDPRYPGRYIPKPGEELIPKGETMYRIVVENIAGVDSIWAETIVPAAFPDPPPLDVDPANLDSTQYVIIKQVYPDSVHLVRNYETMTRNSPIIIWTWPDVAGAGGFTGMVVNETDKDKLIPLDPDWEPEDEDDEKDDDYRSRTGFTTYRYDERKATLPWIFFQWEGRTRIELRAISQDYYDYLFSGFRAMQGLLDKPLSNIHGGMGIFAGTSKYNIRVKMVRAE